MVPSEQAGRPSVLASPAEPLALNRSHDSGSLQRESLQRPRENSALFPVLTSFWLASAFLRFGAAIFATSPSIFTDELTYWSLARSFHHGAHFIALNRHVDFPAQLYSILLSPLFGAGDSNVVYVLVKLVSCLMLSAVVFPAYFLARELMDRRDAMAVTLLSLLVPGGIYTATVMAENLYYPAFVLSAWLAYRALYRGTLRDAVWAGVAFAFTYFVKPHVLFLMAAYGVTVGLWFCSQLARSSSVNLAMRREFPGLVRRAVPFAVFVCALPIRYFESIGYAHSLAGLVFGESYLGAIRLDVHHIPLGTFLTSGIWLFGVILISTAWLPVLSVLGSAFQWRRLAEAQRWFWVLTVTASGIFLVMITRHNALNDGILRTHERYVFQLSPMLFTWYFASRKQLPTRWLVAAGAIVVVATSIMMARSVNALTWNNASDSPTLSGMFWMHLRYPNRLAVILAGLLCGGLFCLLAALATRRLATQVGLWAIFLISCNAGWYGLRLQFIKPEVQRFNNLAMYLKASVPRTDSVAVLEDDVDVRCGWYANFWLSQPFYYYAWKQRKDWFAVPLTAAADGSLDFGGQRPQILLASDSVTLPYAAIHDFPEVHLRMYRVPPPTGTN